MKILTTSILSMAMLLIMPAFVSAQVFNGSLTLSTQAEVDVFNYTEVTGSLTIGYAAGPTLSDINNLQPLSTLTKIGMLLIIRNNNQLQDLQGLENLTTIGASFGIVNNASLTSLQGLENLISVEGALSIGNNNQLANLQGLENLTTVGRSIIEENASLTSLQGLENLKTIGSIRFTANNQLQNLQGLESLITIDRELTITNNAGLTSLQGLDNLTSIGDALDINNNNQLQDLQGLENLTSIGRSMIINNNNQLQDLQGLENLASVESISIEDNDLLENIEDLGKALSNISSTGSISLINLPKLTSLNGLQNATALGELVIGNVHQLQNLMELANLTSLGVLHIHNIDQLQDLQGLENITDLYTLILEDNASLTSLEHLGSMRSNCDLIIIHNNGQLQDLQGLENVSSASYIEINDNAQLQDIKALENLSSVAYLLISANDQLQSLQGLEKITSISLGLNVSNNDQLTDLQGLKNMTRIGFYSNPNNAQGQEIQHLTHSSEMGNQSEQGVEEMRSTSLTEDDVFEGLYINGNDLLKNLKGLDNLTIVDIYEGNVTIASNASLTSLQGLENLTSINTDFEDGGNVFIIENPSLTSLQGLENLTRVDADLFITNNPALVSLQGLNNLSSVVFYFHIENNEQLENLKGLESLTFAEGIIIENNNQLENLEGLENVSRISDLRIIDNPVLNDCCAIAELISKGQFARISGNGSNCNSVEAIQESCPPVITSFTLIDAVTDQDVLDLDERSAPKVINVLETGTELNFRANTVGGVGSVVFALDGVIVNKENVAPYALFGDEPTGDYRAGMLTQGRHALTATPYDKKNGKGNPGFPLTVEFIIVDKESAVINFFLVNTENDHYLGELKEGSIISLQQVDNTKLNIEANTFPETVGSVVFDLNKVKNFNTENTPPYALAGDIPAYDYKDYTLTPGTYHLTATPYAKPKGRGEAGNPLSITFEVVEEDQIALARTVSTVAPKSKEVGKSVEDFEDLSVTQDAARVWVYPNPSDEVLQVRVAGLHNGQSPVNLILYNPLGKKVWEGTAVPNRTAHVEISHLSGGVYFLKTMGNGYTHVERILVK